MSECNLHKDVVNPFEMNSTNNLILDCDQSITALIEELNDLDMFPNNVQNHCNIDNVENNMINNPNDCCSNNNSNNNDNNMETEDNDNNMETKDNDRDEARHIFDIPNHCNVYENNMVNDNLDDYHSNNDNMDNNMETENNVTDEASNNICATKSIKYRNDNLMQSCISSINVNNFAYDSDSSNDNTNKDPDYCYTTDSEYSDEENIIAQQCPTKSNNTTKSSLETSLNVSGQKICDDTNLRIECSKPGGLQKQNFCYYCKKMQSKISRHLERVHKNEKEVEKFITLPKGIENVVDI